MKLYYYVDPRGNFGDDLNPWLWHQLIPDLIDDREDELFVGIGTLLNNRVPSEPRKIIFGSGAGYGSSLPTIDEKWKFYCVRGPITATKLDLAKDLAITDSAALVSKVFNSSRMIRSGIAFVPHHVSAWNMDWAAICGELGIRYIDPRRGVDTVLSEIARSSAIITEAMHGAIISDAFRIPWMPVVFYEHILAEKWMDWTQSLSLGYEPAYLGGAFCSDYNFSDVDKLKIGIKRVLRRVGIDPVQWTPPPRKSSRREVDGFLEGFRKLVEQPRLVLSKDEVFGNALDRLQEQLQRLKNDQR